MKVLILIIALLTVYIAMIPAVEINTEYEKYLEMLIEEAQANLKTLPSRQAERYTEMLQENRDIIMAFILAKEESSKLVLADPEVVLSHYQAVAILWERLSDKYPIPFFLSYIGKITVTEERITPYRELFKEYGLYELPQEYPELEDLVREVNLWTRRYMTFQPTSGRDMAPTDIINRTNIGRCEEMMIFFISAARSLGIPARPASTPYWAHTDNNHAWVEVYVNGTWRHLGAVEPAYHLDDAWFSANAAKAIIITATAAFPDTSEIVIGQRGYVSAINSTPYYDGEDTKARNVKVVTKDAEGEIIPECQVLLQVFNWGSLRPILRSKTNEEGYLELVTGNGSFFVSASVDSLFGLHLIPADVDGYIAELTLKPVDRLSSFSSKLIYRDKEVEKLPAADDWDDRRRQVVEEYNDLVASYQDLAFPDEKADSLLIEVWEKTRNNKENFLIFYNDREPEDGFFYYLNKIDPKFLWQAEPSQFSHLYDAYLPVKDLDYPEEAILSILSPTVFFEEIPAASLAEDLGRWRGQEDRLAKITDYLLNAYEIDNDKAVQTFQMPADILMELPILTDHQFKILTCAVLNANHLPARYERIPDVVRVFTDGSWKYYNIKENRFLSEDREEKESFNVFFKTVDEFDYPIALDSRQFSLTFLRDGIFWANETPLRINAENILKATLEEGVYHLHIGYRIDSNITHFTMHNFVVSQEEIEDIIILREYPRKWTEINEDIAGLISMVHEEIPEVKNLRYLLIGDYDREIVRRVSDELALQAEPASYMWIGSTLSSDAPSFYRVTKSYEKWLEEHPEYQYKVTTILQEADKKTTYFDGIWDRLPE